MNSNLENKTVLVTGGAGGIGRYISKAFANEGAKVIVHYHNSKENAKKLANEINGTALNCDLTDSDGTVSLFNKITQTEGNLDICIANAGYYPKESSTLWNIDANRWDNTISTNLSIAFNTSREFLKHASQTKKGNLVLIGSTAGIYGEAGHSDYAAAKGAITSGLLKTLKNEAAQIGNVRVNAIAPGWTLTEKKINEGLNEKHVERVVSTMALKKLAKPEDIANSAVMLASDSLSNHITGQVIEIAGGMEGRQITGTK